MHSAPPLLLLFGEILWDMVPAGAQPGGATANVAVTAHTCGADVLLVSAVGNDLPGQNMLALLRERNLPTEGIRISTTLPTGSVNVALSAEGQPSYTIHTGVAWDAIPVDAHVLAAAARARAFYFGSLVQRSAVSRESLRKVLAALPEHCLRFFDINLRLPLPSTEVIHFSLNHTDILKLNEDELPVLARWLELPQGESEFATALFAAFPIRTLLLTKGERGSVIFEAGEALPKSVPATPVSHITNTVGAGDAFSAGYLVSRLLGIGSEKAAAVGSTLAAKVCQLDGAWLTADSAVSSAELTALAR